MSCPSLSLLVRTLQLLEVCENFCGHYFEGFLIKDLVLENQLSSDSSIDFLRLQQEALGLVIKTYLVLT